LCQFPPAAHIGHGHWYDVFGYRQIIAAQPYLAESPSIVYTYPLVLMPVPIVYQQIAMAGSAATAWSPPVINAVTPNHWPAGDTTTVTITGDGFGYSPGLTIGGIGVISYTNPRASTNSGPSCNSTIVATVTLDANTPGGMVETITANGLTPSGFLPVPVQGHSGKATAQATTQPFIAPLPQIRFNETFLAAREASLSLSFLDGTQGQGRLVIFFGPSTGFNLTMVAWGPSIQFRVVLSQ